jgi:hypothetical protein
VERFFDAQVIEQGQFLWHIADPWTRDSAFR